MPLRRRRRRDIGRRAVCGSAPRRAQVVMRLLRLGPQRRLGPLSLLQRRAALLLAPGCSRRERGVLVLLRAGTERLLRLPPLAPRLGQRLLLALRRSTLDRPLGCLCLRLRLGRRCLSLQLLALHRRLQLGLRLRHRRVLGPARRLCLLFRLALLAPRLRHLLCRRLLGACRFLGRLLRNLLARSGALHVAELLAHLGAARLQLCPPLAQRLLSLASLDVDELQLLALGLLLVLLLRPLPLRRRPPRACLLLEPLELLGRALPLRLELLTPCRRLLLPLRMLLLQPRQLLLPPRHLLLRRRLLLRQLPLAILELALRLVRVPLQRAPLGIHLPLHLETLPLECDLGNLPPRLCLVAPRLVPTRLVRHPRGGRRVARGVAHPAHILALLSRILLCTRCLLAKLLATPLPRQPALRPALGCPPLRRLVALRATPAAAAALLLLGPAASGLGATERLAGATPERRQPAKHLAGPRGVWQHGREGLDAAALLLRVAPLLRAAARLLVLLLLVQLLVVLVARVVPYALAGSKVEVVDLAVIGLARLPVLGEWRLERLARNPAQVVVLRALHAQPLGILLDLLGRRLVVLVDVLLKNDRLRTGRWRGCGWVGGWEREGKGWGVERTSMPRQPRAGNRARLSLRTSRWYPP